MPGLGFPLLLSVVSIRSGEHLGPCFTTVWGRAIFAIVTVRGKRLTFLMALGVGFFDVPGHDLFLSTFGWVAIFQGLPFFKRERSRIGSLGTEIVSPMQACATRLLLEAYHTS